MTILNIYYLRHGHACNNVSKHFRKYTGSNVNNSNSKYIPDGILTNKGVEQCKVLNGKIKLTPDLVLTSELVRTIETGLEVFKNKMKKIYVVPFISEKRLKYAFNSDIDPRAYTFDVLNEYLISNYSADEKYPKVDFSIIKHFNNGSSILRVEPDEDKLFYDLMPYLIKKFHLKDNSNIFIISHANYLNHHFLKRHGSNIPKYDNAEIRSDRLTITEDDIYFDNLILYKPIFYDNHDLTKIKKTDIERCFSTDTGYKLAHEFNIYKIDGTIST